MLIVALEVLAVAAIVAGVVVVAGAGYGLIVGGLLGVAACEYLDSRPRATS